MKVCIDSSFLVSSYLSDANSAESDRRRQSPPDFWLTSLNRSEFAHAVFQQAFRGHLTPSEARKLWAAFDEDCANGVWLTIRLPESIWRTSVELAQRYGSQMGMRTLDTLHVACALELAADRFWTFDARQERLAQAAGLNTLG